MLDLLSNKTAVTTNGPAGQASTDSITAIPLCQILDNPYQPRAHYDPEHILNLALSIKGMKRDIPATLGLQQVPLARLVFPQRDGEVEIAPRAAYENSKAHRIIHTERDAFVQLMFGHSRLRAFMVLSEGLKRLRDGTAIGLSFAGISEIETRFAELLDPDLDYTVMPLMLGFALDNAMWRHAITENSQRKNISAIEEARTMQRAVEEFGLSTEEAGKPFGYQRSTAANKLRLLNLPPEVQKAIDAGDLTERHGRELLRLADDPERVRLAAKQAVDKGLTVRQLTENVNWSSQELQKEQARAQEMNAAQIALAKGWCLPGQTDPVPFSTLTDLPEYKLSEFAQDDAKDVALLTGGHCGPHCPCFVVGYMTWRFEQGYRPDPVKAPHVCAACSDRNCKLNKRNALEIEDSSDEARAKREAAAAKKQQIEAINNEAHGIWQAWLKEQDRHTLWNSINFWKAAFKFHHWGIEEIVKKAPDAQTACTELLKLLYRSTRKYDDKLGEQVHTVAEVQALIKTLGSVSRETDEYAGIEQVIEEGDNE